MGRPGASGVESRIEDYSYPGVTDIRTINGVPAGQDGADGAFGRAVVALENNIFRLGGGDDTLELFLRREGPGVTRVSNNVFDGGEGYETLYLGPQGYYYDPSPLPSAVLNVNLGTLRLGFSPVLNSVTGFERFVLTPNSDRVVDARGSDQSYFGGAGADVFRFLRGHGNDVIEDFGADDKVRLPSLAYLDTFEEILAMMEETFEGTLLWTSNTDSILFIGRTIADFTADNFIL